MLTRATECKRPIGYPCDTMMQRIALVSVSIYTQSEYENCRRLSSIWQETTTMNKEKNENKELKSVIISSQKSLAIMARYLYK